MIDAPDSVPLPMQLLRDALVDTPAGSFDDYRRTVNASALRLGVLITVAVQLPFLVFEWLALEESFWLVQGLRALWLGPLLGLYPFLKEPSDALLRRIDGIIWAVYVASAVYIVVVACLDQGYQSPYIHGLVLMFVGVCAVTLWPIRSAASFAAVVYGAYWLPLLLGYGTVGEFTSWVGYQCFMVGTMGIVLISQQLRLEMAKADFDRRCQLEERESETRALLERVGVMREERLTWLESLARFLRHEMRNKIVAIATSLDLAESSPADTEPERYLRRARRSLVSMTRLVERATEATSLEAALALESLERVDMSMVVGERVVLFRRAHPKRRFRADVPSGVEIRGQEDRIGQLLDKLLENAVRHASSDGEIRVSLAQHDGEVVLAVENTGAPLPPNRDRLFDAFVSGANGDSGPRNLGLGLFVAKAVAEAHGGEIVALDARDAPGARFEVSFPVS
jgi:signal transduction histidine kinase